MQEYLRVKQNETGTELSLSRTQYDFAPDAFTVLEDKAAVDAGGTPLPAKYKTTASAEAAKRAKTGQKADSPKEND